jgi:hypothetical protein
MHKVREGRHSYLAHLDLATHHWCANGFSVRLWAVGTGDALDGYHWYARLGDPFKSKLRRQAWFWIAMTVSAALHVPLILFVPWTARWVPALAITVGATADFFRHTLDSDRRNVTDTICPTGSCFASGKHSVFHSFRAQKNLIGSQTVGRTSQRATCRNVTPKRGI